MEAIPAASWDVEKRVAQFVVPRVLDWEGEKPSAKVWGMGMKNGSEPSATLDGAVACCLARDMHILRVWGRPWRCPCMYRLLQLYGRLIPFSRAAESDQEEETVF